MQLIYLLLPAAISLLFALPVYGEQTIYCEAKSELAKHEGEYARKDIWVNFRTAKDWNSLGKVISRDANVISITIPTSGEFYGASNHWHEGASVCIKFDGISLWAADKPVSFLNGNLTAIKDGVWVGPFVRVGPAFSEKSVYFNQLFGNKCFESNRGEQWCFGSGYIQVADYTYIAELVGRCQLS